MVIWGKSSLGSENSHEVRVRLMCEKQGGSQSSRVSEREKEQKIHTFFPEMSKSCSLSFQFPVCSLIWASSFPHDCTGFLHYPGTPRWSSTLKSGRLLELISNHVTLLLKSQRGSLLDKVQNFCLEIKIFLCWLPSYLFIFKSGLCLVKTFLHLIQPVLQSKSKALLICWLPANS